MESIRDQEPTAMRRIQTRRSAAEAAALGSPYLLMNVAATLIAGFGLFEDSPAVIIGAMLIAALIGPIQGMAMALAEADLTLLRMSLTAEVTGAALVLVLGMALGTIDRTSPLGHEILSRTAPNILDLLIGLVGGAAAAYAAAGRAGGVVPRLVCLAVLLLLGFHLFNVFQRTFGEATLRSKTRQLVEHELQRFPGTNLVDVTIQDRFGLTAAFVVVKGPRPITSEEVGHMNDLLNGVFGEPVDLHLRSEIAVDTTRDGAVAAAEIRPNP
jgi:hypothetical protein